jgi:hypothetical protein
LGIKYLTLILMLMTVYYIEQEGGNKWLYAPKDPRCSASSAFYVKKDVIYYEKDNKTFVDSRALNDLAVNIAIFYGDKAYFEYMDEDNLEYIVHCLKNEQEGEYETLYSAENGQINYTVWQMDVYEPLDKEKLTLVAEENCYGFDPEVNGVGVTDLIEDQKKELISRIIDYICADPAVLQRFVDDFIKTNAEDSEDLGYCEQCGSHSTRWTLEI